jgi:hypothetical protein
MFGPFHESWGVAPGSILNVAPLGLNAHPKRSDSGDASAFAPPLKFHPTIDQRYLSRFLVPKSLTKPGQLSTTHFPCTLRFLKQSIHGAHSDGRGVSASRERAPQNSTLIKNAKKNYCTRSALVRRSPLLTVASREGGFFNLRALMVRVGRRLTTVYLRFTLGH